VQNPDPGLIPTNNIDEENIGIKKIKSWSNILRRYFKTYTKKKKNNTRAYIYLYK